MRDLLAVTGKCDRFHDFTYTSSASDSSLRRRAFLVGFAVPFRTVSAGGESRVLLTGRLGDGDFCLGGGELSSPEDSSPPARARSSASKSAMMNGPDEFLSGRLVRSSPVEARPEFHFK